MSQENQYIGKGLAYPWVLDRGKLVLDGGVELIRSSIQIILRWNGERRFFLYEFYSQLHDLLEEPNDYVLTNLINTYIVESLNQWETRVELLSADLEELDSDSLNLKLEYRILKTNKVDSFVFPFYKQILY